MMEMRIFIALLARVRQSQQEIKSLVDSNINNINYIIGAVKDEKMAKKMKRTYVVVAVTIAVSRDR
jgi:hypothetical protein